MTAPRQSFSFLLTAITTIAAIAIVSSGCTSTLSGVGGKGNYACRAPAGTMCTSVSGVYANSIHGPPPTSALPKPAQKPAKEPANTPPSTIGTFAPAAAAEPNTPAAAMRSPPRVLRLWIAPWEDADGDLHEAAVIHVLVDTGRWLIEHVRPAQRSGIDAVHPPEQAVTPATTPAIQDGSTEPGLDRFPERASMQPGHSADQEP